MNQYQSFDEIENAIIHERNNDIKKISKDVKDLSETFQDVQRLVFYQGDLLNNIENNVESSLLDTHSGVSELKKASYYSAKNRTVLCMIILLFFIFICIGIIIYIINKN